MRTKNTIAAAGLLLSVAACTTTETDMAEDAPKAAAPAKTAQSGTATNARQAAARSTDRRFGYGIIMEGETRINKNRFVAVYRDGTREPVPPQFLRTERSRRSDQTAIIYTFGSDKRLREVCIGTRHCGVFSPLAGERNRYFTVFPEGFEIPNNLTHHFVAVGCPKCYHTGYQGRKAIYEVIPITKELSVEIKNNILEVDSYLKENKITTLRENAISMVLEGNTSIEEVYALLTN